MHSKLQPAGVLLCMHFTGRNSNRTPLRTLLINTLSLCCVQETRAIYRKTLDNPKNVITHVNQSHAKFASSQSLPKLDRSKIQWNPHNRSLNVSRLSIVKLPPQRTEYDVDLLSYAFAYVVWHTPTLMWQREESFGGKRNIPRMLGRESNARHIPWIDAALTRSMCDASNSFPGE